jgi:Nodulation protein Z (NodZ)
MKKFVLIHLFIFPLMAFHAKGPCLIVNNPHNSGMFAVFSSVLGALDLYEREGFSGVQVNLDGWYLDPVKGPNWWEYFFEPIRIGVKKPARYHAVSFEETKMHIYNALHLPRERAHQLIERYIRIRPEILQARDDFVRDYFNGFYVIGVHHRGTDKGTECPLVPYEVTKNKVEECMKQYGKAYIYVATDEARFLDYMITAFPGQVIYNDFSRSTNDMPLHVSSHLYQGNYQKGREALLDCLLLAKCDVLIRPSSSCLSVTAGRFNLQQPQVIVRAKGQDKSLDFY